MKHESQRHHRWGQPTTHRIDVEQASLIAGAYLDAPSGAHDAMARAAYEELSEQANRWFDHLAGGRARRPVRVVYTGRPEPYDDARQISECVRRHRVLEIFPAARDRDRRHPLLDTSVGGAFDRFRAVHDIVSHGWCGYGFDRHGEFTAWLNEDRIYTGLARWALATELHGEHSVRWTSGSVAEHKAVLLDPRLVAASRARGERVGPPAAARPRACRQPGRRPAR